MIGRELRARASGALLALALASCGYSPVREVVPSSREIRVIAGVSHVAAPLAMADLLEGARAELASRAALGDGGARLVLDVVSTNEESSGVLAHDGQPLARGSFVSLTVHGRLELHDAGATHDEDGNADLGDALVSMEIGAESSTATDALRRDDALRELARRGGRELAQRAIAHSAEFRSVRGVAPTAPQ